MNKRGGAIALSFSIMLIGSFILSILLFANQFAVDNSATVSLSGDTNLNQSIQNMNASLRLYADENNVSIVSLYGSSIEPGSDTLSRVSTFSSGTEESLPDVTDSGKTALTTIFGGNNYIWVIGGAFATFLGVVAGLYAWKSLKAGAPD